MGEIAKSSGRKFVYLEVKTDNVAAIKFYRKNGLIATGVLSTYYQGESGLLMSGDL
jgi:ribosomal protein S18 acetylase RimI-like enzyme